MRIAIVHYWLLGMRGGEIVLEALCRLLPGADIFTLFYDPQRVSPFLRSQNVHASFLNPARRFYRSLLPVMPFALESFDLRGYDLVVSSESGPAKAVIAPSGARHVCYCHTPMRYLWDLYPDYLHDFTRSRWKRLTMAGLASWLRTWDFASAARVDEFVANSENVRQRIWRTYRRRAQVVYPPVAVETYYWRPAEDYCLAVAELVPYKRLNYAVRVFSRTGRRLKIVGDGPEYKQLRRLAGSTVEFCGRVTEAELRKLYAHSRALVVPGEEDFGMNMVGSLASGKPLVALGRGGAKEIAGRKHGILYNEPTEPALEEALARLESVSFDRDALQSHAQRFSENEFRRRMRGVLFAAAPRLTRRPAARSDKLELEDWPSG